MKASQILSISILALTVFTQSCSAQSEVGTYADFFKKHKNKDEVVSFDLPAGLIRLFISKEEKELKQLLKDVDDIKILKYESSSDSIEYIVSELNRCLPSKLYNDLMVVYDGGEKIEFKIREKNDKVNELIMIVTKSSSFFVLSIEGEIELDKVKDLCKSIDVKGLQYF